MTFAGAVGKIGEFSILGVVTSLVTNRVDVDHLISGNHSAIPWRRSQGCFGWHGGKQAHRTLGLHRVGP
jgi:hypothetical protein